MTCCDYIGIAKGAARRVERLAVWRRLGYDFDDLVQTALVGVIKGTTDYDGRGVLPAYLWQRACWALSELVKRANDKWRNAGEPLTCQPPELEDDGVWHPSVDPVEPDDELEFVLRRARELRPHGDAPDILAAVARGESLVDISRQRGTSRSAASFVYRKLVDQLRADPVIRRAA